MGLKYKVVAIAGTYNDRQTNAEKKVYKTVGGVIAKQDGTFSMYLDSTFNPAGLEKQQDGKVWLGLYPPEDRQQAPQQAAPAQQPAHIDDEEPPF